MPDSEFFRRSLAESDPQVFKGIQDELIRQRNTLELIASENITSPAVLEAQGSVLTNKYAEGYSGKRYYGGCQYVDVIEDIAIERAKQLFEAQYVNVQPHSGSQANQAVFLALLKPSETILSLALDCGGHLTHGASVNLSGKWFNSLHYTVDKNDYLIDYAQAEALALLHKPKLIIAGYSAYPREIDFARFRKIADRVGAYLLADISHISGLVAAKVTDNPIRHAHVVTTTTHKTLRGPRGGMIMTNHADIAKLINSAVFPGLQGGPLMHVIAAKAVAFGEALRDDYRVYVKNLVQNCKALANRLVTRGCNLVSGGTDNHLLILDLRVHGITGKQLSESMERAALTANKNSIPFEQQKPTITSGIRLGSAACTTRGLQEQDFMQIADWISDIIEKIACNSADLTHVETAVAQQVHDMCKKFPIY